MYKTVFLDRDGVVNEPIIRNGRPFPPRSVSETVISPGVHQGLSQLKNKGFLLIVITNQPDLARKISKQDEVDQINRFLANNLPLDDFFVCPHDDVDFCDCRKPKPGLIFRSMEKYPIDLKNSFLVGDRWRDVEAGIAAGCATVFINRNYAEKQPTTVDFEVNNFAEAVDVILGEINEFS